MDEARVDRPFDIDEEGADQPVEEESAGNGFDEAAEENSGDEENNNSVSDTSEFEVTDDTETAGLREKLQETKDRMLRVAADFENYRKRIEREKSEYLKYANERLMRDLLPVVDNLTRAVGSARGSDETGAIADGVELVLQGLMEALKKFGVMPMKTVEQTFDPLFHEALQTAESDEVEPGTIIDEVQCGYTMFERVLRPAMVVVAASPEETSPGVDIPEQDEATEETDSGE